MVHVIHSLEEKTIIGCGQDSFQEVVVDTRVNARPLPPRVGSAERQSCRLKPCQMKLYITVPIFFNPLVWTVQISIPTWPTQLNR